MERLVFFGGPWFLKVELNQACFKLFVKIVMKDMLFLHNEVTSRGGHSSS